MYKVMLVDDNPLSIEGIRKNIDWASLESAVTYVCYNGKTAIDTLEKDPVDLIISDIKMPDLDGISMSQQAIALNPFAKVLLISAYDKFEYAQSAIKLGVFDYIEKPINFKYLAVQLSSAIDLLKKERHNAKLIEKSRPALIDRFYSELLHSTSREAEYKLASYENYLGLTLNYNFYITVIIQIENEYELKNALGIPQYEMQLYNISDTINEFCQVFDSFYLLKELDSFALIICQNSSNSNHIFQVLYKIADAITVKYESYGFHLNIGIGNIVQNLWDLNISYQSARHALEYRFFFPQKNIFDSKEVLGRNFSLDSLAMIDEDELIKLICKKNRKDISVWIQHLKKELSAEGLSKNLYFICIHSLLDKILKFLYELNLDTTDLQESIVKTYANLDEFSTMDQLFSWLYTICISACQKVDSSLTTYHSQLCTSVVNYIKGNFSNIDLCLNELAKYANVSPSYLSALFKKTENVSISEVITNIRIDAACKMLETSSLSLKEISDKCGYANQYYFSTTFKKKKNMTPSAYRDLSGIPS